eukprot:s2021_g2.t1
MRTPTEGIEETSAFDATAAPGARAMTLIQWPGLFDSQENLAESQATAQGGQAAGPRSLWPRDGGLPMEPLVTRPAGSAMARSNNSPEAAAGTNALLERCRKAEQEVEMLRREKQSMEQQLSQYKQHLHQAQEAAQAQSEKCKHAEQEVQMLRREKQSMEQQLSQCKQQLHQAQEAAQAQSEKCKHAEQEVQMLREQDSIELSQYKEQLHPQENAPRHSERFKNAEQELQMLRQQHQSMEQQLSLSKQQLRHAKDESQQQLFELEHQLAEASTKLKDVEQLKAQLTEAQGQLQAQQLDLSSSQQKTLLARRHAAEVERQRKELARNAGVQARQRLTEELETALSEKAALEKRLKKAQRSFTEEQRLRGSLVQEMEISASELRTFKDEASELARTREQLRLDAVGVVTSQQARQQERGSRAHLQPALLQHFIGGGGYRLVADLNQVMPYGERWFHVWQHPRKQELIIIKEPGPNSNLVVTCSLKAAPPEGIEASFAFLSGRILGTYIYSGITPCFPLLLKDLQEEAAFQFREQGLQETARQQVQVMLPDFHGLLPDPVPLWVYGDITEENLQQRLLHLRSLSNSERRSLAEEYEDVFSSSEFSGTEIESCASTHSSG